MGGGGNQGTVQDKGQPHNEQGQGAHQGPGVAIPARLKTITNHYEDTVIGRELDWQSRVEGDQTKGNAFCDQAVNQTTFRAFAFMKGHSPVVHMAHSIGQFFGMSGLAAEVQGKYIGFIGDQGNGQYPVLFIPPPTKRVGMVANQVPHREKPIQKPFCGARHLGPTVDNRGQC